MVLNCFDRRLIADPPIVSLNLGSTLSPEDIKEGDDVYFECHIRANPPWSKLTWIHDVRMIDHQWNRQAADIYAISHIYGGN